MQLTSASAKVPYCVGVAPVKGDGIVGLLPSGTSGPVQPCGVGVTVDGWHRVR